MLTLTRRMLENTLNSLNTEQKIEIISFEDMLLSLNVVGVIDAKLKESIGEALKAVSKQEVALVDDKETDDGSILRYHIGKDPLDEIMELFDKYQEGTPPRSSKFLEGE